MQFSLQRHLRRVGSLFAFMAPAGARGRRVGGNSNEIRDIFAAWFISFACFAQDSDTYFACSKKANTQGEMTACAGEEATRTDAKLNSVALLAKVASQPETAAKIKAAERAWIAYRDAYIEATYPAKGKAPNAAPSILSTSPYFAPSSRSAKSPPSKTCRNITRPSNTSEMRPCRVQALEVKINEKY
jgi:uncharacterized protein YecT (DUF1311 family)